MAGRPSGGPDSERWLISSSIRRISSRLPPWKVATRACMSPPRWCRAGRLGRVDKRPPVQRVLRKLSSSTGESLCRDPRVVLDGDDEPDDLGIGEEEEGDDSGVQQAANQDEKPSRATFDDRTDPMTKPIAPMTATT